MDSIQDFVQEKDDFLLFQVDSDERAGMMWGDAGSLFWLADYRKLVRGGVEDAWLEAPCS